MTSPAISVILPTYNAERYVAESIHSILAQTFGDFELLVVDDGNTDNTHAIVRAIADNRIRLIKNNANLGIPQTRNIALVAAKGEFVASQDADDISHSTRLEKQIAYMRAHPEVGVVGVNRQTMDAKGKIRNHKPMPPKIDIRQLQEGNRVISASAMMRHSVVREVGGYDEWFATAEDYDLWLRMAGIAYVHNLPEALYIIRQHTESTTTKDPRAGELYRMAVLHKHADKLTADMRTDVEQNGILAYEKYIKGNDRYAFTKSMAAAYKKTKNYDKALREYKTLAEYHTRIHGKITWKIKRNVWLMKWKAKQ